MTVRNGESYRTKCWSCGKDITIVSTILGNKIPTDDGITKHFCRKKMITVRG